jgi:hypothetical protein
LPGILGAIVKKAIACFLVVLPCCCAIAQQQERKLVDRIMEPDMSLENEAQNKKFTADKTSVNKRANVRTFYVQQKSPGKTFAGTRDFSSNQFQSRNYNQQDDATVRDLAGKKSSAGSYSEATKAAGTKGVSEANKSQSSRPYAGNRPYLEQGKSQKSLNRKNKPMTIDEVRELLNKNK